MKGENYMLRNTFEWLDKKFDEAIDDVDKKRAKAKAKRLGVIEGLLNAMVIYGMISTIGDVAYLCSKRK